MTALIAHLSDIHFGAVDETAVDKLAAHINDAGVDAVVVTGDLTQAGRRREYRAAAEYLARFTAPTLTVPGNHDAPVYSFGQRMLDPWRRFRRYIGPEDFQTLELGNVFILGLNSARRANASFNWSLGRLSPRQLSTAKKILKAKSRAALRLVAFHHPVLPGAGRAGNALINKPRAAMNNFAEAGADLLLTGHVHIAQARLHKTDHRPLLVTAAGTATSTRLRGEAPSFNLLRWTGDALDVVIHRYTEDGYIKEKTCAYSRMGNIWRAGKNNESNIIHQ